MKKFTPLMLLAFCACAVNPLTIEETKVGVAHSVGGQACYQKGWISNPQVMASYLNAVQSKLNGRGDPAVIQSMEVQAAREANSSALTIEGCRVLEMQALQYTQQQTEQARQQQAFNNSMQSLSDSAQQMQSQSRPQTTTCQYYQWGEMTTCSSF